MAARNGSKRRKHGLVWHTGMDLKRQRLQTSVTQTHPCRICWRTFNHPISRIGSMSRFSSIIFYCCDKCPLPRQPKKGRIYLVYSSVGARVHCGREIRQQAHDMVLGTTENSHIQTQIRSGEKEMGNFKTLCIITKVVFTECSIICDSKDFMVSLLIMLTGSQQPGLTSLSLWNG